MPADLPTEPWSDARPAWPMWKRCAFPFAAAYFFLYAFPFPFSSVGTWLGSWTTTLTTWVYSTWGDIVPWVAGQIGVELPTRPGGSGDTSYNYVQQLTRVVLAFVTGLIWLVLFRRVRSYRLLAGMLWVGARYYVAFFMLSYGFSKVFYNQFPFPRLSRLEMPLGDASPMGLAWRFMGYSAEYNIFAGGAEVLGGLLLLLRPTATLGALICVAVMANVVAMNFCFDIPVKLFSTHLLIFSAGIALPDFVRLMNVFVLNRAAQPRDLRGALTNNWVRRLRWIPKLALVGYALHLHGYGQYQRGLPKEDPPLYGIWDVDSFAADGEDLPPLTTDEFRWDKMIIERLGVATVHRMNGERTTYRCKVYPEKERVRFSPYGTLKPRWDCDMETFEDGRFRLVGEVDGRELDVTFRPRDLESFELVSRGFHWVNETVPHR